ncbi:unnamed protein product [Ambrosiozyma monospora]|uniref:Unnamed protein product n=1 Tax=Ambrosiozyma monospora TaxID=43982 RepID=A0ACB5SZL8_AMBMO|nr:unnamed protein product [Ambrosiozyma monospora]
MFNSKSKTSSPFGALDRSNKSKKQSSLTSFFSQAKSRPKNNNPFGSLSRSSSSLSSSFSSTQPSLFSSLDKSSERSIGSVFSSSFSKKRSHGSLEDDDEVQRIEDPSSLPQKTEISTEISSKDAVATSLSRTISFNDSATIEDLDSSTVKPANFKHSKPIQKTKSFVSNSNSIFLGSQNSNKHLSNTKYASVSAFPLSQKSTNSLNGSLGFSQKTSQVTSMKTASFSSSSSSSQSSFSSSQFVSPLANSTQLSSSMSGKSKSGSKSKKMKLPWMDKSKQIKKQASMSNPRLVKTEKVTYSIRQSQHLSDEQQRVIDMVLNEKKSIFYTGSAGTGKSYLLKKLIRQLQARYGKSAVAVTASTGLAATNIEGTTIFRFAGIGLGTDKISSLIGRVKKSRHAVKRWRETKVLIIDEVSMIDSEIFNKLNEVAKAVRASYRPFGGIQLVVTGDFFQLPPVSLGRGNAKFCFDSDAWKETLQQTVVLTKVFRQQGDNDLIEMLNALRIGKIDPEIKEKFMKLQRPLVYEDGILPTEF